MFKGPIIKPDLWWGKVHETSKHMNDDFVETSQLAIFVFIEMVKDQVPSMVRCFQ
jgi:hypothetical protein